MSNKVTQELEIEVEYGVIAAKVWNKPTKGCKKILAIHGWRDNAGSFDKLIPLLEHPNGIHVLAIDLPGQGRSSKLPKDAPYYDLVSLVAIRYFVRAIGWNKKNHSQIQLDDAIAEETLAAIKLNQLSLSSDENCINNDDKYVLLGHSMGAGLSMWYAGLYLEDIEQVISLDFLKPPTMPIGELLQQLSSTIDQALQLITSGCNVDNDKEEKVAVTKDNIIYAMIYEHQTFSGHLERDDAMCLFARASEPAPGKKDKYHSTSEPKLGLMLNYRDHVDFMRNIIMGLNCHCLTILAKRGVYNPRKKYPLTRDFDYLKNEMDVHCKTFHLEWMNYCDHFLHMNNAGSVASVINDALLNPGDI